MVVEPVVLVRQARTARTRRTGVRLVGRRSAPRGQAGVCRGPHRRGAGWFDRTTFRGGPGSGGWFTETAGKETGHDHAWNRPLPDPGPGRHPDRDGGIADY